MSVVIALVWSFCLALVFFLWRAARGNGPSCPRCGGIHYVRHRHRKRLKRRCAGCGDATWEE